MVACLRVRMGSDPRLRLAAATVAAILACTSPSGSTPAVAPPEAGAARTWYMAPDVRCGGGKGTLEAPWCIQDALESARVKPGDTIHARLGGAYRLAQTGGSFSTIRATISGTPDKRITVRPYPPDQTTPTTLIRVACDQPDEEKAVNCMSIESNWVDYYEFEVANFGNPRRQRITGQFDRGDFGSGVRVNANTRKTTGVGNRLINWVVHDTAANVYKSDRANPTEFYGMVNYNYGFLYTTEKVRRVGGHGFYLRNGLGGRGKCASAADDTPAELALVDNIVSAAIRVEGYAASSLAYQDYGTCACVMHRNERFEGNFFIGGTLSGGCPANRDSTLGTRDQILRDNWWSSYTIGYNAAGCDNVTIDRNFMFRPMYSTADKYYLNRSPIYFMQQRNEKVNPCRSRVKFTNNTFWGNADKIEGSKRKSEKKDDDAVNGFKAEWFPDEGNVYLPNDKPPDKNYTAVRPNKFRPGSCSVYVANFLDAASVPVDLSSCGLAEGARYEIRSIYDYMGKPVGTGTFSPAAPRVELPMTPAANPISDSVGHLEGGAPGSYPNMKHSVTKPGGNIFKNAFVVLTTGAPTAAEAAKP